MLTRIKAILMWGLLVAVAPLGCGGEGPMFATPMDGQTALDGMVFGAEGNDARMLGQQVYRNLPTENARDFVVQVTMQNTGKTTWEMGEHSLVPAPEAHGWGITSVPLPAQTAPGAMATFAFSIVPPSTPGFHTFSWQMQQTGVGQFGAASEPVEVEVNDVSRLISIENGEFVEGAGGRTWVPSGSTVMLYVDAPTGSCCGFRKLWVGNSGNSDHLS